MITKLAPCNDNVLIRPVEAEKESPGGIALPESLQERERPSRGTIVADARTREARGSPDGGDREAGSLRRDVAGVARL